MPDDVLVEVCLDSAASALAAQAGGARRVELCDDLVEGGTTPSVGMIAATCESVSIGVMVMVAVALWSGIVTLPVSASV